MKPEPDSPLWCEARLNTPLLGDFPSSMVGHEIQSASRQYWMRHTDRARLVNSSEENVLTINAGSSSIRFAIYKRTSSPQVQLEGKVDRIGLEGTNLTATLHGRPMRIAGRFIASDHRAAVVSVLDWLEKQASFSVVGAVGHRVVHGMKHAIPLRVNTKLLEQLRRITPYDPDHLPIEISLIEAVCQRHPHLPQVACFDTAFHRTMPEVARLLPIPWKYSAQGVERYGFHGLSYEYLVEELGRLRDPAAKRGSLGPRSFGKRRQPRGSARWKERRHETGIHTGGGLAHEYPLW